MKRMFMICAIFFFAFISTGNIASAGSINGNEAGVLSAAQGTFSYQGKNYVAKQSYIQQLSAKMSADDVDMTAQQASKAIASMYSNVAAAVQKGYLEEVSSLGEQSTQEQSPDSSDAKSSSAEKEKSEKKSKHSLKADKTQAPVQTQTPASTPEDEDYLQNDLSVQVQNWTPSPATKGAFQFHLKRAAKQFGMSEQTSPKKVSHVMISQYRRPVSTVAKVIALVIFVIVLVVLSIRKSGRFQKIVPAGAGIALISFGLLLMGFSGAYMYGFTSGKVLVNAVAEQGYYNQVYKDFHKSSQNLLKTAGFPKTVLDNLFDERSIYLDGKLALEATFNSNRTRAFMNIQSDVQKTLMMYLSDQKYTNISQLSDSLNNFSGLLDRDYKDSLKFTYAGYLKSTRRADRKHLMHIMIAGGICFLLGILEMLLTQKYIHRIFRGFSYGTIVSSLSMAFSSVFYLFFYKHKSLSFVPNAYNTFFVHYLKWNSQLLLAFAAFIFLLGLLSMVMTNSLKKMHRSNPIFLKHLV